MDNHQQEFVKVFSTSYEALYRYAATFLAGHVRVIEPEDILQDVFVKAYTKAVTNSIFSDPHLRNYLFASVRNTCINALKKRGNKVHQYSESIEYIDVQANDILLAHDFSEFVEWIRSFLKPEDFIFFHKFHVEGFSHDELQEETGILSGTIAVRLYRTRNKIAKKIRSERPSLGEAFSKYFKDE